MATTVVFGDTADGQVQGSSTTYATARSTATTADSSAPTQQVGQLFSTPTYFCLELFLGFDTSAITGTITSATLSLVDQVDNSVTDFVIECRLYDWGATLTTADWVPGASISQTLLATYNTASGWTGNTYKDFTDVAMAANINQSGFTRFLLNSDRHRLGTTPTGEERVSCSMADDAGTTNDPKLTIVTVPAAALTGTATSGMTEANVVAGGKVLTITLTDATWIPA